MWRAPARAHIEPSVLDLPRSARARAVPRHARAHPAAHQRVLALIALLLAPTIPFDSPYAPIPLVFAVLGYAWAQHNATRYERPELLIAGGLLFGQLMLVTAVVVDDRQHSVGLAHPGLAAGRGGRALLVARGVGVHGVHAGADVRRRRWRFDGERRPARPDPADAAGRDRAGGGADVGGHPRDRRPAPQRRDPRRADRDAEPDGAGRADARDRAPGDGDRRIRSRSIVADVDHFKAVNDTPRPRRRRPRPARPGLRDAQGAARVRPRLPRRRRGVRA